LTGIREPRREFSVHGDNPRGFHVTRAAIVLAVLIIFPANGEHAGAKEPPTELEIVRALGEYRSRTGAESLARRWGPEIREKLLRHLARRGLLRRWISTALATVGEPADALPLAEAFPDRFSKGRWHIHREDEEALTALAARDETVARKLLSAKSALVRIAAVCALIRGRHATPEQVLAHLTGLGAHGRRRAHAEMCANSERWACVLIEHLADPATPGLDGSYDGSVLRRALQAGSLDADLARVRLEKHHASPHVFVRVRAAEAMLGLSRETGEDWLRTELQILEGWKRGYSVSCTGRRGGLTGTLDALLDPQPDPYDTEGPATVLPVDAFRPVVVRIPYRTGLTFDVLILNAEDRPFEYYPNGSGWIRPRMKSESAVQGFGMAWSSSHSHVLRRAARGEPMFTSRLSFTESELAELLDLDVNLTRTVPGRRRVTYRTRVPAARLIVAPDLATFLAGLTSENKAVRRIFHRTLRDDSTRTGEQDSERCPVPVSERPVIAEALLGELFRIARTEKGTLNHEILASLRSLDHPLSDEHADRLLALGSPGAMRDLRGYGRVGVIAKARDAAMRRARGSRNPTVVNNLSYLLGHDRRCAVLSEPETIEAVGRWLTSEAEDLAAAGLRVARHHPDLFTVAAREAGLVTALSAKSPDIVEEAIQAVRHVRDTPHPDLLRIYRERCGDRLGSSALGAWARVAGKRRGPCPPEVRALVDEILASFETATERDRRSVATLIGACSDLSDPAFLVPVWRRTRYDRFCGILSSGGYDFGSPLLPRILGSSVIMKRIRSLPWDVARVEAERLLDENPPSPAVRFTAALLEAVRVGNYRLAAAFCIPLALETDEPSRRALEITCGSDDPWLRLRAMWCLHLGSPRRAGPFIREAIKDPRFPGGGRRVEVELADLELGD
jgi:hypothetical protein